MANPFGTAEMAAGYANARPPVHPRVMDLAWRDLERTRPFRRALDIGCGAGLSTKALAAFVETAVGLEPAVEMLHWASGASYLAAKAEALPFQTAAFDLITAAGSLNYVDLDRFYAEAARVLTPEGLLLVYDFSPPLDPWWQAFYDRYPPPAHEARVLNPQILAAAAPVLHHREFQIGLSLTPDFFLDYVMTETNVASALRRGVPASEIRSWCAATLAPLWTGPTREVFFPGYYVWMLHPK
jgi:SAM-dependent methyltransferase